MLTSMHRMRRSTDAPRYPIESVGNALTVLQMLQAGETVKVGDVAAQLGIARSTAHRLLATMQFHGFVTMNEPGQTYVAGHQLLRLGATAVARLQVRRIAHGPLLELARSTGETCELGILDGSSVLRVDVVEGTHRLRVVDRVGTRSAALSSAAGMAILATLPDVEVQKLLGTLEDQQVLESEVWRRISDVRQRGFAITSPGSGSGIFALACALASPDTEAKAAVTLVVPASRVPAGSSDGLARAVVATAQAVDDLLAHAAARPDGQAPT